jgi:Raf kinase inhibitor-like YbhB/YbcL family protein
MKDKIVTVTANNNTSYLQLQISSTAFENNKIIPSKYTCDGMNVNPPLDIKDIPAATKVLALVMDDPDAPVGTWVHWVVWDIPVTNHLEENSVHGKQGVNDFMKHAYGGPCPPSGTHRYFFKIYALDKTLLLPDTTGKQTLEKAMSGHILAYGELCGLYRRIK